MGKARTAVALICTFNTLLLGRYGRRCHMKARRMLVSVIAGSMLATWTAGCDVEDTVGRSTFEAYEVAVFGTFRGIRVGHSVHGTLLLDTTSYVHIDKSDGNYSIRVCGTDQRTRTISVLFEETGSVSVADVKYAAPQDWSLGYWKGLLTFTPDPVSGHTMWWLEFTVSDVDAGRETLTASGDTGKIPLAQQNTFLRIMGWRPLPYPQ